jgi:hypothetical protein
MFRDLQSLMRLVAHPMTHENVLWPIWIAAIQVGRGFSPDVAAEAATHLRFALNGERERITGNVIFGTEKFIGYDAKLSARRLNSSSFNDRLQLVA